MSDIEKKARYLLADEYERRGSHCMADEIRVTALAEFGDDDFATAICAVIAALTPPEGFVLVPVEPTEEMAWAPTDVEVGYPTWAGSRETCTTEEAKAIWAAMLAARPETPDA